MSFLKYTVFFVLILLIACIAGSTLHKVFPKHDAAICNPNSLLLSPVPTLHNPLQPSFFKFHPKPNT